jgi:hypothetical protein
VRPTGLLCHFLAFSTTPIPRVVMGLVVVALLGSCSVEPVDIESKRATAAGGSVGPAEEEFVPFDIRPLLTPPRKYLGVALDGAPNSLRPVRDFAAQIGKQPNMLKYYAAWGDEFDAQGVRNAQAVGALPVMEWEPFEPSMADIAKGASDDYVRKVATAVRALNLPVAISFGHEMNGNWYPWGTKATAPADFVRAWQRTHDIFLDVGATTAIWVWTPNVINPVRGVPLQPLYPGDSYVDWVGMVGYYTDNGARSFSTLFGPTRHAVREFTGKPFLILETGSEPGSRKRKDIADLFTGVAASPDVIGFIWFNHVKRADWRVDSDPLALAQFRRSANNELFGFDVNRL